MPRTKPPLCETCSKIYGGKPVASNHKCKGRTSNQTRTQRDSTLRNQRLHSTLNVNGLKVSLSREQGAKWECPYCGSGVRRDDHLARHMKKCSLLGPAHNSLPLLPSQPSTDRATETLTPSEGEVEPDSVSVADYRCLSNLCLKIGRGQSVKACLMSSIGKVLS
jgi:predicted RNA-binding Zn-ribbon protein involved in translation (DUF1610 family)